MGIVDVLDPPMNVKNLDTDVVFPQTESFVDLPDGFWDSAEDLIRTNRETADLQTSSWVVEYASCMKLLAPERFARLNISNRDIKHFYDMTDGEFRNDLDSWLKDMAGIKTLSPDLFNSLNISSEKIDEAIRTFRLKRFTALGNSNIPNAWVNLAIIAPEKIQKFRLPRRNLRNIRPYLSFETTYATLAANIKLLFPERFHELGVSEDTMEKFRRKFSEHQKEGHIMRPFKYEWALHIAILSSPYARITPDGINLDKPKTQAVSAPQVPEERSF